MPIVIAGVATSTQSSGTNIDIPVPSEAEPGDLLIAFQGDQSTVSDFNAGNSDFTRLTPWISRDPAGRVIGIWAKIHTWGSSFNFARTGDNTRSVGAMMALRGYDDTYLDDSVDEYSGTPISGGRRVESLVASGPGLQIFFARAEFVAGNSSTPLITPLGFTEAASWQTGFGTSGSRSGGWLGYREVEAGVAEGTSIMWSSPSAPSVQSVIIRAAEVESPVDSGLKWWNGSEYINLKMYSWGENEYIKTEGL